LRGEDFERETAEQIVLLAANNCTPEFDKAEALKKVERAYNEWEPNEQRPEPKAALAGVVSAKDLLHKRFKEPVCVVQDTIPEGVGILAGKPKIGKSFKALGDCIAVATGKGALGGKLAVTEGRALYLALEDSQRRLQQRLRDMLAGELVPEKLDFATEWPRVGEGCEEALRGYLNEHPETRLVYIDTLKKIRPRERGNKGVCDADYEALEPLLPIAAEYGVAIQVVHHVNKLIDPDDPLDSVSGSTGLTGGVDSISILSRERGTADAFLFVTGRDIEEQRYALKFDQYLTSWVLQGEAAEFQMSEERRAIVEVLRSEGQPLSAAAVAQALGKGRTAVTNLIGKMVKSGVLIEPLPHKYTVALLGGVTGGDGDRGDTDDNCDKGGVSPGVTGGDDTQKAAICRENGEAVMGVTGITGDEEGVAELNEIFHCSDDPDIWFPRYQTFRGKHGGANVDRWAKIIEERMAPA
jgi:biotin operon repressor